MQLLPLVLVFVTYNGIFKLLLVRIQVTSLLNLHMVVSHERPKVTICINTGDELEVFFQGNGL